MNVPPFRSTPVDSRRLTTPAHLIGRQSPAARQRVHGELLPMACPEPRRRGPIQPMQDERGERGAWIAAWTLAAILLALVILPGLAWLADGAPRTAHPRPEPSRRAEPVEGRAHPADEASWPRAAP